MPRDEPVGLPLSPLTMAILLALAKGALHGYALMREVERQTDGTLVPGTGSLYAALYRLADAGLIEEAPVAADVPGRGSRAGAVGRSHPGRPRKRYRITAAGQALARAEATRMKRVLAVARRRLGEEAEGQRPNAGASGAELQPARGDA